MRALPTTKSSVPFLPSLAWRGHRKGKDSFIKCLFKKKKKGAHPHGGEAEEGLCLEAGTRRPTQPQRTPKAARPGMSQAPRHTVSLLTALS